MWCSCSRHAVPVASQMSLPPSDSPTNLLLLSVALFVAGAGVNGPKTMCGLEVRERFPGASGSSGALLGLLGQLGAAAAGYPLTRVHEAYGGWDGTYLAVLCCAVLCYAHGVVLPCPALRYVFLPAPWSSVPPLTSFFLCCCRRHARCCRVRRCAGHFACDVGASDHRLWLATGARRDWGAATHAARGCGCEETGVIEYGTWWVKFDKRWLTEL
jgi:hypothetical protein